MKIILNKNFALTLSFLGLVFFSYVSFAQNAEVSVATDNVNANQPVNVEVENAQKPDLIESSSTPNTSANDVNRIFDGDLRNLKTDIKSLMFDQGFLATFYKTINLGQPLEKNDATSTIEGTKIDEAVTNYKAFYLSSIVFDNDDSWTIWLNRKKIRSSAPLTEGLKIKTVEKNYIIASFISNNLPHINSVAQANFNKIENAEWDYISKNGDIKINSRVGEIEFTLKLNQSFSEQKLENVEGFAAPVEIDLSPKVEAPAENTQAPATDDGKGFSTAPPLLKPEAASVAPAIP
jgi:hypothetical protein